MKTQIEFQHFYLRNGAKIILVKRPERYTATLAGYLKAGSAHETVKVSGASHFVEHLLFRGNKKSKTAKAIDEEKDRLGISYSATTNYDHVRYQASFPPDETEKVLEFSAAALFESVLAEKEIEKERQVMIEEEKLREDDAGIRVWDLTLKTRLKNKNHPLCLPREGLLNTIRTLEAYDLKSFYKKHFTPANLTLVIGSSLEFTRLQKIIEKVFEKFKKGDTVYPPKFSRRDFSKFEIKVAGKEVEKVYLYFTFPAFSYDKPLKDRLAINLLSRILSRIRLEQRLYQEQGLSYDWYAGWSIPAHPVGIFYLYSSCEPKNLGEIVKIFCQELKKLQTKLVSQAELERVRDYFNKIQPMDFDSLSGAVDWLLDDFYYFGKFHSPEEIIATRNKITIQNLFKIAKEIFNFSKLNLVVLGPITQKEVQRVVAKHLS